MSHDQYEDGEPAKTNSPGKIKKLVGKLRSNQNNTPNKSKHDVPSVKRTFSSDGKKPSPRGSETVSPDASQSLDLWNSAYLSLADNPRTSGLVLTYKTIIAQELPDDLKKGPTSPLDTGPADARLELMSVITSAGLRKRLSAKGIHSDDPARRILDFTKDSVASSLTAYPSAAMAWSGFSILTPLLVDPMLRNREMKDGLVYVVGSITWYMSLTQLLSRSAWQDEQMSEVKRRESRQKIQALYHRILEFEMNCVCATASTWNPVAKNVVDWQGFGTMLKNIQETDRDLDACIQEFAADDVKARLRARGKNLQLLLSDVERSGADEAQTNGGAIAT